jgi:dUTP pyrophosphatase
MERSWTEPPATGSDEALCVQLLTPAARAPVRASADAAGYDLFAAAAVVVPPSGGRALVPTDVAVAVPPGTYGRVAPRSGLAVKHGIDVGAGVIDADYRGAVSVVLFNHGAAPFAVAAGDRVAQLVLSRIATPAVAVVAHLPSTTRGAGGFGSTGGVSAGL